MSLKRVCRDLVLEVVLRRALSVDGDELARLQVIVDEEALRVLNAFLRMGELHSEGVISMELIDAPREPLPALDALYFLRPETSNVDRILADFKSAVAPQHRQVHFCFTQPLSAELLAKLAEAPNLSSRVKSLVEVPLSFVVSHHRGFHFDMPEALLDLFPVPNHQQVSQVVRKLVDVCRCLQSITPTVRYGPSELCREVAEQVLSELAMHKDPSKSGVPCQLLIVDRSIDMAAILVHEFTYEACVYDLLDGGMLDGDKGVVTVSDPSKRDVMLSDSDPLWEELKYRHLESVQGLVHNKIQEVKGQTAFKDAAAMSTSEMLDLLRGSPDQRDAMSRLFLHSSMTDQIFKCLEREKIWDVVGAIEQDTACGVDRSGKDVKVTNLQSSLTRVFGDHKDHISSETKLRLLMLYFASVDNISQVVRDKLIELAQLDASDEQVLMALTRTRLTEVPEAQRHKHGSGCVHRATKQQAARFKKNAQRDGAFELSRFEPRVKHLLEQMAEHQLKTEEFPVCESGEGTGDLRQTGATVHEAHGAPAIQEQDEWTFASFAGPGSRASETPDEVAQRLIVFVLGGFTHSELRAASEIESKLPRGTEVLIGGTSLLTAKRLIRMLRPKSQNLVDDPEDLT